VDEVLKNIGFTRGEINVYLALLELGESATGNIIKKSKVSGSKVYEVLDRLISKGLVSSITKNNLRIFDAADPNKILSYLDEKVEFLKKEKDAVHSIIPQLILRRHQKAKSSAKVYTGFEGLKTVNEQLINNLGRGDEWLSMGLSSQPKSWEIYFNKKQVERAKKGIIQRHLINEKYKSLAEQRKKLAYTHFRYLPQEFEMPTSTEIYGDTVAIMILLQEDPFVIVIESAAVANSFRKYFNHLWNTSKRN